MSTSAAISRHERRRQETADRIVETGATLFAEQGVVATTISEICERADIARQTFFNHFQSKQALVDELAHRGLAYFLEALDTACREAESTGERIGRLLDDLYRAGSATGPMHQDLIAEVVRASIEMADEPRVRSLERGLETMLRAGRKQGDVSRRFPLEDQVGLILGAIQYLFFEWTHRPDFPMAERSARMARLLATALAP